MSDENKKSEDTLDNITNIDDARVRRLKERGHMSSLLEEYEKLRLKFFYDQNMDKIEAMRLVTLCKYFIENGPSESFRLSCKYFYEKYCKPYGL